MPAEVLHPVLQEIFQIVRRAAARDKTELKIARVKLERFDNAIPLEFTDKQRIRFVEYVNSAKAIIDSIEMHPELGSTQFAPSLEALERKGRRV